jgi:hypothetical protein
MLSFDARPGPFASTLVLHEQAEFVGRTSSSDAWLSAGADLDLRLPLVRRYSSVAHFVEPLVRGGASGVRFAESEPIGEDLLLAAAGLHTVLGDYGARWGALLDVEGGVVGRPRDPEAVVAGRAVFDTRPFALSAEGVWAPELDESGVLIARTRLGESDGIYLGARAEAATERVPVGGRRFFRDGWARPEAPWLDRSGWTTGSELGVGWVESLGTVFGVDYDASARRLLGWRGILRYRHACACLSALTWASHRLGRGGFDAGFALDLMP